MIRNLWLKEDLLSATEATRIHHQLAPMTLYHESSLSKVRRVHYKEAIFENFKKTLHTWL